jgi:hypothetical protein
LSQKGPLTKKILTLSREEQEAHELSHIHQKMVHLQAKAAAFKEVAEARRAFKDILKISTYGT